MNDEKMREWVEEILSFKSFRMKGGLLPLILPQFHSCDYEKKELSIIFRPEKWQNNPEGGLHGGMAVTYLDTAFGILCKFFSEGKMVCTVNMSTNFLKYIEISDLVYCNVKITNWGKTIVSLNGNIRLERDNILATTATATFMILDKEVNLGD